VEPVGLKWRNDAAQRRGAKMRAVPASVGAAAAQAFCVPDKLETSVMMALQGTGVTESFKASHSAQFDLGSVEG
jgi:hypothetical protein